MQIEGVAAELLDALPVMVVVARKSDGAIVFANRQAAESFGRADGVLADMPTSSYFARPEECAVAISALEQRGRLDRYEAEVVGPQGEKLVVSGFAAQFEHEGEELIIAGFNDVTQRNELSRQLHLGYRHEALRRVSASIAHQLSNALVPVLTFAELANIGAQTEETQKDYLARIVGGAERCARLVNEIREFSRVKPASIREFDLNDVVLRAKSLLDAVLPQQIDVAAGCGDEPLTISADSRLLEVVIVGMALRAGDAIGKRPGGLRMSAAPGPAADGAAVAVLEIAYTGGPLSQPTPAGDNVDLFSTPDDGRFGMAVSVAHDILREMQGTMEIVHTAANSTIRMTFPIAGVIA